MMKKASFILVFVLLVGGGFYIYLNREKPSEQGAFEVALTEEEWKERLSPEEFHILREEGTESAFSSPLNEEKREGVFVCAGCEREVFHSSHKFKSGTGWPSFYQPLEPSAVGTKPDYKLVVPRTEIYCSRCGSHLGHVFEDGPEPTGLRYCINGVALDFEPRQSK